MIFKLKQVLKIVITFVLYKILRLETEQSRLNHYYKSRIDTKTGTDYDKKKTTTKVDTSISVILAKRCLTSSSYFLSRSPSVLIDSYVITKIIKLSIITSKVVV